MNSHSLRPGCFPKRLNPKRTATRLIWSGSVKQTVSRFVFGTILGSQRIPKSFRKGNSIFGFFAILHDGKSVIESNSELLSGLPPVCHRHRPFTTDSGIGQIDKFFEGRIIWENAFIFSDFTDLTVVSLDGIRRVNHPSNLGRKIEIGTQSGPVIRPALDDDRLMFAPLVM